MPAGVNVESGTPEMGNKGNISDTYTEATTDWSIPLGGTILTNTDRVVGNYCILFRTNSGTTRNITLTPSTPIDATSKDRFAFWCKIFGKNGSWNYLRCYTDGTNLNYYELVLPSIIHDTKWHLNEFLKTAFTPVGTPDWSNVEKIEFNTTANIPPIFAWGLDGLGFYSGTPYMWTVEDGTPQVGIFDWIGGGDAVPGTNWIGQNTFDMYVSIPVAGKVTRIIVWCRHTAGDIIKFKAFRRSGMTWYWIGNLLTHTFTTTTGAAGEKMIFDVPAFPVAPGDEIAFYTNGTSQVAVNLGVGSGYTFFTIPQDRESNFTGADLAASVMANVSVGYLGGTVQIDP